MFYFVKLSKYAQHESCSLDSYLYDRNFVFANILKMPVPVWCYRADTAHYFLQNFEHNADLKWLIFLIVNIGCSKKKLQIYGSALRGIISSNNN
jgi:hypothetical protein